MKTLVFLLLAVSLHAGEPLPLMETVTLNGIAIATNKPPKGLVLNRDLGLLSASAMKGQVVHRTQTRILETRATITPKGDYLLMFPEGDHYAKSKGEKINSMMACRSSDHGKTWSRPAVAYDIPYGQHGFVPLIPRGTQRIYCFGTQPVPGKWTWENGQRENAPIGYRWSDDDGHTWSETKLIAPLNDPEFKGMSVMRMTETDAGTWLIGSHLADWSVKPFTTQQYLLRSEDKGATWTLLPGARPKGWFAEGFNRMDEGRPLNLGSGHVLFMSRTPQGHLFTAWSKDDGKTWTDPLPSTLVHPDAPPMVFPLSDGKTLVAFHHNKVPVTGNGELSDKAELMKMRSEVWGSLSTDEDHTWSPPRFVLANAVAPVHAVSEFNSQCSYLDAFTEDGVLHLFMPHRWQQVLHLTLPESALTHLPSQAFIRKLVSAIPPTPVDALPDESEWTPQDLRLPAILSDYMVLQAGKPVTIWGWAKSGDAITVEFGGQKRYASANAEGEWHVRLDPMQANAEPREMIVASSNPKSAIRNQKLADVLVGEVWLASGQSNMEMQINGKMHGKVDNADAEIAAATHPEIRMFWQDSPFAIYETPVPPDQPMRDRPGKWVVCSPETVAEFSAMGYFVARDLVKELHTPVGIISAAVGGTPIEAWTSREAQESKPVLRPLLDDWTKRLSNFIPEREQKTFLEAKAAWLKQRSDALKAKQLAPKAPSPFKNVGVMKPGRLFNGVIAPLVPYTIRGCLWYQGERNANGPFTGLYGEQLQTLITNWRTRWADEFYFAWVQLPGSLTPQKLPSEPNGWGVAVRDEMRRTLSVPHTGMAITMDIGDPKQGHPTNKADFARRLSTVVLHDVYAKDIPLWTGPLFKSAEIIEGHIILTFDHASGLKPKSDALEGFAIAGEDKKFVWADAKLEGDKVIVSSPGIKEPKAVRYAWAANPKGNLVNGANLPASPFRTDDWK